MDVTPITVVTEPLFTGTTLPRPTPTAHDFTQQFYVNPGMIQAPFGAVLLTTAYLML
jgi:hypothetical protein